MGIFVILYQKSIFQTVRNCLLNVPVVSVHGAVKSICFVILITKATLNKFPVSRPDSTIFACERVAHFHYYDWKLLHPLFAAQKLLEPVKSCLKTCSFLSNNKNSTQMWSLCWFDSTADTWGEIVQSECKNNRNNNGIFRAITRCMRAEDGKQENLFGVA